MGGGLALALYGLFGNDEDAAVLGGITAGVGTGMAIYGFMKSGDAKDKIDWLMNEGRIKGYVSFHMNPKRQSVGVFYTLIF